MAYEIFDEDGDGVYELVQFDSCLRYFKDDCFLVHGTAPISNTVKPRTNISPKVS